MAREFKTTEDVIAAGKEKKLITIRDGRITYEGMKEKKTYQFTDPEEKVRARVYVELIEKYKYPAGRIFTGPQDYSNITSEADWKNMTLDFMTKNFHDTNSHHFSTIPLVVLECDPN